MLWVLIADVSFNVLPTGGTSQLWALCIANRVTGILYTLAPNGNIYFEQEIMEIIWLPLHLNKSGPQWRVQVVQWGPLNIHQRLLPCKIY